MRSILRQLALPLALVGLLAAMLGFLVMRSLAAGGQAPSAEVSVVGIPATPSPTPTVAPTPEPAERTSTSGRSRGGAGAARDPRCPSGCECQFPPNGTVVVCRGGGGTVTVP